MHIRHIKFTHPHHKQSESNFRLSLSFTGKCFTSRSQTKGSIIPVWKFGAKSIVKVRLWDFSCHSKITYPDIQRFFFLLLAIPIPRALPKKWKGNRSEWEKWDISKPCQNQQGLKILGKTEELATLTPFSCLGSHVVESGLLLTAALQSQRFCFCRWKSSWSRSPLSLQVKHSFPGPLWSSLLQWAQRSVIKSRKAH